MKNKKVPFDTPVDYEQKCLDIFRLYTPKLMGSIEKVIKANHQSAFTLKVHAYHALKHRISTYMGFAFEDIAATLGVGMINLNLDQHGNRPKSKRVQGVDLENGEYCIQLKSSLVSENGTGKQGYDKALKKSAKQRNKTPMIAIAICSKPPKRRKTNKIIYAEGKNFWELYVGIPYDAVLKAKSAFEREMQTMVDNYINETVNT